MRLSFKMKLAVIIAAIAIGSAVFWLSRPAEFENIVVTAESRVITTDEGQVLTLYIQNTGTRKAEIYRIICNSNFTFTEDVIILGGVKAIVSFPIVGGPVGIETISGSEEASGGGEAISDYDPASPFLVGTSYAVSVYTRSGGYYTFMQIVRVYEY